MKPSPAVGVRSFRAVAMADLPSLAAQIEADCAEARRRLAASASS